jgi:hypothetical protein
MVGLVGALLLGVAAVAATASSNGSEMPASKVALAQREQNQIAAGRATAYLHPKLAPGSKPVIPSAAPPTRSPGIINMRQGPFPSTDFAVSNFWQGPIGSNWFLVYAGSDASGAGALRIYTETPELAIAYVGTFVAPGQVTALSIVSIDGVDLHTLSANGEVKIFSLAHLAYI